MLLVALSVPDDSAGHIHVVPLFDVKSGKAFLNGFDRNIHKCNVRSIEHLAWISVEEVLKLKDWRVAHGVACQGLD